MPKFIPETLISFLLLFSVSGNTWIAAETAPDMNEEISACIKMLGDDSYKVRTQAIERLVEIGADVLPDLEVASESLDLTTADAARYCMSIIGDAYVFSSDTPEVRQLMQNYGHVSIEERRLMINKLLKIPFTDSFKVLMRVIFYEKDDLYAQSLAADILWRLQEVKWSEHPDAEALKDYHQFHYMAENAFKKKTTQNSAMKWLIELTKDFQPSGEVEDQVKTLSRFKQLIDDSVKSIKTRRSSSPSSLQAMCVEMLSIQKMGLFCVDTLWRMGYKDDARRLQRSIQTQNLFAGIPTQSMELYVVGYYELIIMLLQRNLTELAFLECEWLTSKSMSQNILVYSIPLVANLYSDYERYEEAGATLTPLMANTSLNRLYKSTKTIRKINIPGLLNYYKAMEAFKKGSLELTLDYLRQTVQLNEDEADALIMGWKIFSPDDELQVQGKLGFTPEKIKSERDYYDAVINRVLARCEANFSSSEKFTHYNLYAWLAANTNRNLDKAEMYALQTLAANENSGAIRDTYAHVLFAKGDLEGAVREEEIAVMNEPHVQALQRSLKRFQSALDAKKKTPAVNVPEKKEAVPQ